MASLARNEPDQKPAPTHRLFEIIRGFKTFSSTKINKNFNINFQWQRSYYEHIIRSEKELELIAGYIRNNPSSWSNDIYNKAE